MDNNTIADAKNRSQKEREVQLNKVYKLMDAGVLVYDPQRLDIRGNLVCGNGVVIDVNVIFEGDVLLEDGVIIGANCILINSKIGKGTHIKPFSKITLENCYKMYGFENCNVEKFYQLPIIWKIPIINCIFT